MHLDLGDNGCECEEDEVELGLDIVNGLEMFHCDTLGDCEYTPSS